MPTYADFGGWVISTIAGWFVVTADTLHDLPDNPRFRGLLNAVGCTTATDNIGFTRRATRHAIQGWSMSVFTADCVKA